MKSGLIEDCLYGHQHNGAYFNPHAYVARVRGIEGLVDGTGIELISVDRALLHELSHWFQYVGTTFGLAICLHRLEQYSTAFNIVMQGDDDRVDEVALLKRVAGHPLISIDADGNFVSTEFAGRQSKILASVWHTQVLTDRILVDSGRLSRNIRLPFDLETMVGDFFIDVTGSSVLFGEYGTLPQNPRGCIKDQPAAIDMYLTSRAVMECAAVVNEYVSFSSADEQTRQLRKRSWRQLVGPGVYGAAARYFCNVVQCGDDGLESWLGSLLLCCDIALNPIIPPLIDLGGILGKPVAWSKLSPVWRFARCVEACKLLRPCAVEDLPYQAAELSQLIAEIAGLEHWRGRELIFRDMPPFLEHLSSLDLMSGERFSGETLFLSYLSDVAKELWRLRQADDLLPFAHGLLAREGMMPNRWFTSPPLLTDEHHERFWHPAPLSSPQTLPFAVTLMSMYVMTDIVAGIGEIDFSPFPSGLKARAKDAIAGIGLGDILSGAPLRFKQRR